MVVYSTANSERNACSRPQPMFYMTQAGRHGPAIGVHVTKSVPTTALHSVDHDGQHPGLHSLPLHINYWLLYFVGINSFTSRAFPPNSGNLLTLHNPRYCSGERKATAPDKRGKRNTSRQRFIKIKPPRTRSSHLKPNSRSAHLAVCGSHAGATVQGVPTFCRLPPANGKYGAGSELSYECDARYIYPTQKSSTLLTSNSGTASTPCKWENNLLSRRLVTKKDLDTPLCR